MEGGLATVSLVKGKNITIIALTGGIASGKSEALKIFQKLNYPTIDCDEIVANIWKDQCFMNTMRRVFNIDDKVIDEKVKMVVSTIIFDSSEKRKQLNDIIHPLVWKEIEKGLTLINAEIVIIDIPLLFETGYKNYDYSLLITIPEQEQIKRLSLRNGINGVDAKKLVDTQMPLAQKFFLADFVIDNSGSKLQLETEIKKFLTELKAELK